MIDRTFAFSWCLVPSGANYRGLDADERHIRLSLAQAELQDRLNDASAKMEESLTVQVTQHAAVDLDPVRGKLLERAEALSQQGGAKWQGISLLFDQVADLYEWRWTPPPPHLHCDNHMIPTSVTFEVGENPGAEFRVCLAAKCEACEIEPVGTTD